MIKNGKEYRIIDLENDPELNFYCDSPNCINRLGYKGLEEFTYQGCRVVDEKVYCEHCILKMFTEDEIRVLKDEAHERLLKRLEEQHGECVRNGYGLSL
jgi:hypothetical protein